MPNKIKEGNENLKSDKLSKINPTKKIEKIIPATIPIIAVIRISNSPDFTLEIPMFFTKSLFIFMLFVQRYVSAVPYSG